MKRIAYAGTEPGCGVTTQALQMYSYLDYLGKEVCLVMEKKQYDNYIKDPDYSDIELMSMDKIGNSDHEYMIIDYGAASEPGFKKGVFATERAKIVVCTESEPTPLDFSTMFGDITGEKRIISFPGKHGTCGEEVYTAEKSLDPKVLTKTCICQQIFESFDNVLNTKIDLNGISRKSIALIDRKKKKERDEREKKAKNPVKTKPKGGLLGTIVPLAVVAVFILGLRASYPDTNIKDFLYVLGRYLWIAM